jgi:hypothetical protein
MDRQEEIAHRRLRRIVIDFEIADLEPLRVELTDARRLCGGATTRASPPARARSARRRR